jgi:hypothetical protein
MKRTFVSERDNEYLFRFVLDLKHRGYFSGVEAFEDTEGFIEMRWEGIEVENWFGKIEDLKQNSRLSVDKECLVPEFVISLNFWVVDVAAVLKLQHCIAEFVLHAFRNLNDEWGWNLDKLRDKIISNKGKRAPFSLAVAPDEEYLERYLGRKPKRSDVGCCCSHVLPV